MLNLGLDFKYEGKRRSIDFFGRASRQVFQSASSVRNPSENLSLTFNNEFSKYDTTIFRGTFNHTREPGLNTAEFDLNACRDYYRDSGLSPSQIESTCNDIQAEFERFKGRFDSYNNNFTFTYNRFLTEFLNISTNYRYSRNWSTARAANDSRQNSAGIKANYKYSEATNFTLLYSYQISNYKNGQDIYRHAYNVGIRQYITKRLYFDGSIGQDIVSSGSDSISFETTLNDEVSENTTASLSYIQGSEISVFRADTFRNWQSVLNVESSLSEDFSGSLSAFYGRGRYTSQDITDILSGASFNLSYVFWKSIRGSFIQGKLGYAFSNLDSTLKNRSYTRNSINSGISLVF